LEEETHLGLGGRDTCSIKRLDEFERKIKHTLPQDYKTFCQVFGNVILGDYAQIFCPDAIDTSLFYEAAMLDLEYQNLSSLKIDFSYARHLISSCFPFGKNSNGDYFAWNINTYSEQDKSCDIFLIPTQGMESIYFLCRSFSEFVCDFCLGDKLFQVLPAHICPKPNEIRRTYAQFSLQEADTDMGLDDEDFDNIDDFDLDTLLNENFYQSRLSHLCLTDTLRYYERRLIPQNIEEQLNESLKNKLKSDISYVFFRYLSTLTGHTASVLSIAVSPDGQMLASGSADTTIKLWNLVTGEEVTTLTGHTASVLSIAVSPDGQTLASGSADTTIKLWNLATGEEVTTLEGKSGPVFSTCFVGNSGNLVSIHNGPRATRQMKIWNLASREQTSIATYEDMLALAVSSDGEAIALGGGGISTERAILILDSSSKEPLNLFESGSQFSSYHQDTVYCVEFASNNRIIASGSRDCTIKLWGIPEPLTFD